ncbi:MAG: putative phosphodiesterase [Kiritimatiellia bacterium]|jgi:predicted phosphodiesterase
MNLWAISDLHLGHRPNSEAWRALPAHPDDWLIIAGDVGETLEHLDECFAIATERYARVLYVPGNHELYTTRKDPCQLRGEARYHALIERARRWGVLTPDDPWPVWPGDGPTTTIALMCLLYDYSFAPDGMDPDQAKAWARAQGIVASDERFIGSAPHGSIQDWCHEAVRAAEYRLGQVPAEHQLVLVNHWPLRRDLVRLFRIPGFNPWCGTRLTESWHTRFPATVCVHGHLHMRATDYRDGVRFEEVALGYPRHWKVDRGVGHYLRQILPHMSAPGDGWAGPLWHR